MSESSDPLRRTRTLLGCTRLLRCGRNFVSRTIRYQSSPAAISVFMMRLPWLPLLALLALSEAATSGSLYLPRVTEHAQTALKTYSALSQVQCAGQCSRNTACVQYSRDPDTGLCHLWPNPSAANPLTSSPEPLHLRLPDNFALFDDTVAFGKSDPASGGIPSIKSRCQEQDIRAVPVVPRSTEELLFLKRFGAYTFVGITDEKVENTFADMVTGEPVSVPGSWWETGTPAYTNSHTNDCVYIHIHGHVMLVSVTCNGKYPVICEIRM